MINRYDDFTKLHEMVLGQVNYSPLKLIKDEKDRSFIKHVLDETSMVLNRLDTILKNFNVIVHRPEVFEHKKDMKLGAPYTHIDTVYSSLPSYDNFFTIADTVVVLSSASLLAALVYFV